VSYFFQRRSCVLILTKNEFWAFFSQTHLVTLKYSKEQRMRSATSHSAFSASERIDLNYGLNSENLVTSAPPQFGSVRRIDTRSAIPDPGRTRVSETFFESHRMKAH
jgi:hypothetical protein